MNFQIFFSVFFAVFAALCLFEFIKPAANRSDIVRNFQRSVGIKQKTTITSPLEQERKKLALKDIPDENEI